MVFELLSDLATEEDDGLVYLIQVKRSLDSAALRRYVDEVLAVDGFLGDHFEDERPRFRYEVRCQSRKTTVGPNWQAAVAKALVDEDARRWNELVDRVSITIDRDPMLEIAIEGFHDFRQPVRAAEQLVGRLEALVARGVDAAEIQYELLRLREELIKDRRPSGRVLQPADFEGSTDSDRIVTGQRPTVRDIADGCFMDRSILVRDIVEAIENEATGDESRSMQIVWVSGGSGIGKSVATLQASRALVEAGTVVHDLGSLTSLLPEALVCWLDPDNDRSDVTILVDDVFGPDKRNPEVWHRVYEVIASSENRLPVVLTSGPDDALSAFRQFIAQNELISVREMLLGRLDGKELQEYHDWYCARIGQSTKPVNEGVFAIACFVRELQRQGLNSIHEFAARFRMRLENDLAVFDEIRATLACNSFGLGAPGSLFGDHIAALHRIRDEGIIRASDTGALFCYHPEIARRIYDALCPPDLSADARARDLARALASMDREGRVELLESIQDAWNAGTLSVTSIHADLAATWKVIARDDPPNVSIATLDKWCSLARSAEFTTIDDAVRRRIERWMAELENSALETSRRAWGLLFQSAWQLTPAAERSVLGASALQWLSENDTTRGWSFVWGLVWPTSQRNTELHTLTISWLREQIRDRGWTFVFQRLLADDPNNVLLPSVGLDWVERGELETNADPYIWEKLASLATTNLERFVEVLTLRLCRLRRSDVRTKGLNLLERSISASTPSDKSILQNALCRGLKQGLADSLWPYVFPQLAVSNIRNASFLELGLEWLSQNAMSPSVGYVWNAILVATKGDPRVTELARSWTRAHPNDPNWGAVVVQLANESGWMPPYSEARRWLLDHPDGGGWPILWTRLHELDDSDQALTLAGKDWLWSYRNNGAWTYVWNLLSRVPDPDNLVSHAELRWLRSNQGHQSWGRVWRSAANRSWNDPEFRNFTSRWLDAHPTHTAWESVRELSSQLGEPTANEPGTFRWRRRRRGTRGGKRRRGLT